MTQMEHAHDANGIMYNVHVTNVSCDAYGSDAKSVHDEFWLTGHCSHFKLNFNHEAGVAHVEFDRKSYVAHTFLACANVGISERPIVHVMHLLVTPRRLT
jgi:hypothetical protein